MKKTIIVTSLILLGLWNSSDWARAHDGLGVSSWASWNLRQVTRADCPEWRSVPLILHWKRLEPRLGRDEFDKYLGTPLRAAAENDLHVFLMIWVGPVSPMWIYEMGVPKVYTDRDVNPLGQKMSKEQNRFSYYLAPQYRQRFFELIAAFGDYVRCRINSCGNRLGAETASH